MSRQNPQKPLQHFVRGQIIQKYPPEPQQDFNRYIDSLMLDEQQEQAQNQFLDSILNLQDNEIVEEYQKREEKSTKRARFDFQNIMDEQSERDQVPSRNSSLSSRENHLDLLNRSFQQLPQIRKKISDDFLIENQEKIENHIPYHNNFGVSVMHRDPILALKQRQKTEKITKMQQVGCNCKKSKCLKMYCECFHLQIFCNQNCNCVDCGNMEPNDGHKQAVIDALTRNPKAFIQQQPKTEKGFGIGVQLTEVKKGCKCKKTKCLKKYCQCFNSGVSCGIFCKCQNCQNCGGEQQKQGVE